MATKKPPYQAIDLQLIHFFSKTFLPVARFSIFLVFFWFGILKVFHLSPASPLAQALTQQTIGAQYFDAAFIVLAVLECLIGILFLFPKLTRIVIPLLLIHMVVVCSPLVLVPHYTWQAVFIPTLEGQYIIKNAVVIALAIGIAASVQPFTTRKQA